MTPEMDSVLSELCAVVAGDGTAHHRARQTRHAGEWPALHAAVRNVLEVYEREGADGPAEEEAAHGEEGPDTQDRAAVEPGAGDDERGVLQRTTARTKPKVAPRRRVPKGR